MALLIFDCDGVLVDSEYLFAEVASECFAEIGISMSLQEEARRFAGVSIKDILATVEREAGIALPPGFEASLHRREDEAYSHRLQPIAGIREAISAIDANSSGLWRRCVASSSLPGRISASLTVTGLDDLFPEAQRFSTALVVNGKPAPDIFLHADRKSTRLNSSHSS